jgi:hypothetical protein
MKTAFLLQLDHSFYSNSCDVTRDNGFYWSFDYIETVPETSS